MSETMLDLLDISKELGIRPERLRAAAYRGEFPRILRVTRTAYRVERSAYETWRAVNWLSPADLRSELRPEFLQRAMQLRAATPAPEREGSAGASGGRDGRAR